MDNYTFNDTNIYNLVTNFTTTFYEQDNNFEEGSSKTDENIVHFILNAIGIITNGSLLVVLLVRLVKDVKQRDLVNARWTKRHTLIAKCAVHILYLVVNIIIGCMARSGSNDACQFLQALYLTFTLIGYLYSIVIAYQTILQIFSPASLIRHTQMKFWIGAHLIVWILSIIICGAISNSYYKPYTSQSLDGAKSRCLYIGSRLTFLVYSFVANIIPAIKLLILAIIAGIGLCLDSPSLPLNVDDTMRHWLSRTRISSALFLIIFALFSCITILPTDVLNFMLLLEISIQSYVDHAYSAHVLHIFYYILFPVCCLILEESWLCYAIGKRIGSRET